ncbi:MAG: hypothetical protein BWY75_00500 [bacterium ADurb.Bin425]|nr:MAG: hypothetical protein BWY75_00500 [bacterium ADurb.Bin425]
MRAKGLKSDFRQRRKINLSVSSPKGSIGLNGLKMLIISLCNSFDQVAAIKPDKFPLS